MFLRHQHTHAQTFSPPFVVTIRDGLGTKRGFPSYALTWVPRLVASGAGGVLWVISFPSRVDRASKQNNQQYISRLMLRMGCDVMYAVCYGRWAGAAPGCVLMYVSPLQRSPTPFLSLPPWPLSPQVYLPLLAWQFHLPDLPSLPSPRTHRLLSVLNTVLRNIKSQ